MQPIHGMENVLRAYDWLMPNISFSGPTSFAPAVYHAINIVRASKCAYHILVIIADGQVCSLCRLTVFVDILPFGTVSFLGPGQPSLCEEAAIGVWGCACPDTIRRSAQYQLSTRRVSLQITPGSCLEKTTAAISEASQYPLSIIMVGVRILHLKQ